ncbi:MAG: type IV pilus secretin PilQ [Proteobacteria bacterium]|nr:type IV pilus secretin PilQ [Pseudomonadota bacterium]
MTGNKRAVWKKKWPLFILGVLLVFAGCASGPPAKPAAATPEPTPGEKIIHRIAVSEDTETCRVIMYANQPLTYTAVKHQFPLGVVLYFPDTALEGIQDSYSPPDSTLIKAIQASELRRKRPSSRIEIRLNRDVSYEVTRAENQVLVRLRRKSVVEPSEAKKPEPEEAPQIAKKVQPETREMARAETPVEAQDTSEGNNKAAWVNQIDFQMLEDGKSRVTVGTTRKIRYETQKPSDKRLLLKLFNTRIPDFRRRPLITTRFKSAVDRILPIQSTKMGGTAVIAIELREAVPFRVHQKKNVCIVDFDASSVPPRPMPEAEKPGWIQAMKETEAEVIREVTRPPEKPVVTEAGKTYTGEKISLDFQDADIHNIFRILHEVSGKNFVIGQDVKGRVTLKLANVPWDQVLGLILKMNKLGTVVEGNVVRIAKLDTLAKEFKALEAKVKAEQEAKELEPLVTEYIKLNYANASSLKTHLDEVKSSRGKVTVDEGTNMIIIKDEREALDNAKKLITELDDANQEIATRQVLIEARIVEATRGFTRDLGVQWGGDYYGTGSDGNATTSGRLFGGQNYSSAGQNYAVNLPPSSITSGLGFTFGRIGGTVLNLDIRLLAMEEQGRGRTVSAPKILTLDNKKATIKQVTKIPFQVIEDNTTSIKTEEAGIELSVTPQITRDNRIRMEIYAEKGAPDWSNTVAGNPAIDTNLAETELFVNDGQTIVIGGILTTTDTVSEARVPWLSKVPFFGWLFKQRKTVKNNEELLIFITPKIIRLEETSGPES